MRLVVAIVITLEAVASASPNVSLEDPVYDELATMRAIDKLPAYLGGLRPLTEARVERLLAATGDDSIAAKMSSDWWLRAIDRAALRASLFHETDRPYSTAIRPRDIVGSVALSCEHQEGRPCGDGLGLLGEIDSSAGYSRWVSAATRLQIRSGTSDHDSGVAVDRMYANAELRPLAIEIGRDVLVLGPSSRTEVGWGDHAPPLDQIRLSTSEPLAISDSLRGSLVYVLGRLRAPQRYPGALVSIARGQLDIANRVELGVMQLLQVEGDGAPHLGFWDFIKEHFTRGDPSASTTDSSNRRVGLDVAWRIDGFNGARFYYQLMFEDWRRQFVDALRYDADHVVGLDFAAIGPGHRHGLLIEWQKTGFRSQEHTPRTTGFTNAGRVVGSPLGPDAQALFVGARIELAGATLWPWIELARLSSDTYTYGFHMPIARVTEGVAEARYRAGARVRVPLRAGMRFEAEVLYEHVEAANFDPIDHRENLGVSTAVVWQSRRLP